jgi:hypothetical protein
MVSPQRRLARQQDRRLQRELRSGRCAQEPSAVHAEREDMVTETLREYVACGQAKMAIATTPDLELVEAAMWEGQTVVLRAYSLVDEASLQRLGAAAAARGISHDDLATLLNDQMQAVQGERSQQAAVSIISWKPGEQPPIQLDARDG